MSDEAVLRIVLQDAAQGSTATGSASSAGGGASSSSPSSAQVNVSNYQDQIDKALEDTANAFIDAQVDLRGMLDKKHKEEMVEASRVQDQIDAAMEETANARIDAEVELQEHLKKRNEGLFASLADAAKSLLNGDIGGAIKGITGKGGALENMGVSSDALAAAVPMVGAALIAKQIGDKINAMVVEGIKSGVGAIGGAATSIASVNSDVGGGIASVGDAISSAGQKFDETLGLVNPVVGKFGVFVGESAKAMSAFMQAVDQTAKHYEQYNAQIAMAAAQAEVRQTVRDIARGRVLGSSMGQYVTAKSKLENDIEDIKAELLDALLPTVTTVLETLKTIVELLPDKKGPVIQFGLAVSGITAVKNLLDEINEKTPKKKDPPDPTTLLFSDAMMTDDTSLDEGV